MDSLPSLSSVPFDSKPPSAVRRLRFSLRFAEGRAVLAIQNVPLTVLGVPSGCTVEELQLEVPHVRFPLDVRGGAEQFQSTRLEARRVALRVDPGFVRALLLPRLGAASWQDVQVRVVDGQLEVEARLPVQGRPGGTWVVASVMAVPAPPSAVEWVVTRAFVLGGGRVCGLDVAETLLSVLGAAPHGSSPLVASQDPGRMVVRALLNAHGWKTPGMQALTEVSVDFTAEGIQFMASAEGLPMTGAQREQQAQRAAVMACSSVLGAWRENRADAKALKGMLERARSHPRALAWVADLVAGEPALRADARVLVEDALARRPEDVGLLVARARLNPGDAVSWKAVVDVSRARGECGLLHAASHAWAGTLPDTATADLFEARRTMAEACPESAEAVLGLAFAAVQAGRWTDATSAAERALKLELSPTEQSQAARCLGQACLARRDLGAARRALLRVLGHGEDVDALQGLADVSVQDGQPAEAVRYLLRAAQAATNHLLRASMVAQAAAVTGEHLHDAGGALLLWQQALALNPLPRWKIAAAQAAWEMGELDLVAEWMLPTDGPLPEDPLAARLAGLLLWRRGEQDRLALELLDRAASIPALKDATWEKAREEVQSRLGSAPPSAAMPDSPAATSPAKTAITPGRAQQLLEQVLAQGSGTIAMDGALEALDALDPKARARVLEAVWGRDGGALLGQLDGEQALRLARVWWSQAPGQALPLVRQLAGRGLMDGTQWQHLADAAVMHGSADAQRVAQEELHRAGTISGAALTGSSPEPSIIVPLLVEVPEEESSSSPQSMWASAGRDRTTSKGMSPEERLRWLNEELTRLRAEPNAEHEVVFLSEVLELSRREPAAAVAASVDLQAVVVRLVEVLQARGDHAQAATVLESVDGLELPPRERAWLLRRLATLEDSHLRRPERAIAALQQALAAVPDDEELHRAMTRMLEAQGRFQDLAQLHEGLALLVEGPGQVAHLVAAGEVWATRLGELGKAVGCWQKALRLAPRSDAPLRHVLKQQKRLKPSAVVRTLLMAARLRGEDDSGSLLEDAAEILVGQALKPRLGASVYRAVVASHPQRTSAWRALAQVHLNLREPEQAQQTLELMIAVCADAKARASARAWRAEILANALGRVEEASEELKRAFKDSNDLHSSLPLAQSLARRLERPEELARVALQRVEQAANALETVRVAVVAARELLGLNSPALALELAQKATVAAPTDVQAWMLVKDAAFLLGNAGQEVCALRALLDLPGGPGADAVGSIVARLASLCATQGDVEGAEAAWRKGVELQPDGVKARFHLATLLLSTGKSSEAWALLSGIPEAGVTEVGAVAYCHASSRAALEAGPSNAGEVLQGLVAVIPEPNAQAILWRAVAMLWAQASHPRLAATALEAAWKSAGEGSAEEHGQLIGWRLEGQDVSGAVDALEAAWAKDVEVPPALATKVVEQLQGEDGARVERLLERVPTTALPHVLDVLRGTPRADGVLRRLARLAANRADLAAACDWLGQIKDVTTGDLDQHWRWLAESGRWAEALTIMERLARRELDADAESQLCETAVEVARDRLEDPARAIPYCRRWVELRPDARVARASLVELLEEVGALRDAAVEVAAWASRRGGVEAQALWRKALDLAFDSKDPQVCLQVAEQAHRVLQTAESEYAWTQARGAVASPSVETGASEPAPPTTDTAGGAHGSEDAKNPPVDDARAALRAKAVAAETTGDGPTAVRAWTALAQSGDHAAWVKVGEWLAREGNHAESASAFERASRHGASLDERVAWLHRAAQEWDEAGDSTASDRTRVAAVELEPTNVEAFRTLEKRLRRAGNVDGLPALTLKVARAQTDNRVRVELLESAGLLLREEEGKQARAMEVLEEALGLDATRLACAVALADLAFRQGQLATAARWLGTVPDHASETVTGVSSAELRSRKNACKQALGQAAGEADPDHEHPASSSVDGDVAPSVEEEPERYVAWVQDRARRLHAAGQPDTAARLLDEAVRKRPDSVELALQLARMRKSSQPGRAALILHAVSEMLDRGAPRTPVLMEEATAWKDAGRPQEAAEAAALAWKNSPEDVGLFCTALELAGTAGDDELLIRLGRVYHAMPDPPGLSAHLHLLLARALQKDGRTNGAMLMLHVQHALAAEDSWPVRLLAVEAARRMEEPALLVQHIEAALPLAKDTRVAAALAVEAARAAHGALDQPDRARALAAKARQWAPDDPTVQELFTELVG